MQSGYKYVVEKNSSSTEASLFMLSFSEVEKHWMLHLDGTLSDTCFKTCCKKVYKLLKIDAMTFNQTKRPTETAITTFLVKNLFLNFLEMKPSHTEWKEDELALRYLEGLEFVINCRSNRKINHYFIKKLNLLENDCNVQRAEYFFQAVTPV